MKTDLTLYKLLFPDNLTLALLLHIPIRHNK